jgi:metacaspase-1
MKKNILLALCALAAALALFGCSNVSASSAAKSRYAIVIGVQDYPGTSNDLNYPDDDAESMASLLASKGWTVVSELINTSDTSKNYTSATYANIKSAVTALASYIGTNTNATVLVYYSGHGGLDTEDSNAACIIPYDGVTTTGTTGVDYTKWISSATLTSWLGALSCKNKILILDSCYSGSFVDTGSSVDAIPSSYGTYEGGTEASFLSAALGNFGTLLQNSASGEGDPDVLTITASGADEYSYDDSDHGHGAFTYYLLQAATSGDSDGDGYVTSTEAYAYAKAKIKSVWDAAYASTTSSEFLYYQAYYQHYGYYITSWSDIYARWGYVPDFMPHISGGTGDLVLYDNN